MKKNEDCYEGCTVLNILKTIELVIAWYVNYISIRKFFKKNKERGAWLVQSVEHLVLDFGSGHYLGVMGSSPC